MITLETEFKSSAGGFTPPLTYKQIQRNDTAAIYSRNRNEKVLGYEVFHIKIIPKGFTYKFPNGTTKIIEDDTEQYPSTSQFGLSAWATTNLDRSNFYYQQITNKGTIFDVKPVVAVVAVKVPEAIINTSDLAPGEFTVNMFAEENKMDYIRANLIVKDALTKGIMKIIRTQRIGGARRPSNILIKTS